MAAIFPIGTRVLYGDDLLANTPTYTEIADVTRVGLPVGYSVDEEEITTHGGSGTNKVREFLPTLADRGSITLEVNFDWREGTHSFLVNAANGRGKRAWKIELPIQTAGYTIPQQYEFDGYVNQLDSPEANAQGVIRLTSTVRVASDIQTTDEAA